MTDIFLYRKLDKQSNERLLNFKPKAIMLQYLLKGVLKARGLYKKKTNETNK